MHIHTRNMQCLCSMHMSLLTLTLFQLPKLGTSTKFQGVFWENVETVRTNEVEACFVESPPSVTSKSML